MTKEVEILKRTLAREKIARKEAELLLEKKAYELYISNTELKKLNEGLEKEVINRTEELISANQKLNDFAKVVSHDLKAPLKGINSLIGWLFNDHEEVLTEEGKEHIELIQNRVSKMDAMIQGILEVSSVGNNGIKKEQLELKKVIKDVIELIQPPNNVQINILGNFPILNANYFSLCQIIQNILSNAIKYNDKEVCKIDITGEEEADTWQLIIADNGPGIAAANHEKVFNVFETLDVVKNAESTGVGLSIVKKVIESMDGQIKIESSLGNGCAFHINFKKNA